MRVGRFAVFGVAAVSLALVAGCGGSGGSSTASSSSAKPSVLNIGLNGSGSTLNPGMDSTGGQTTMRALAYAGLIHLNPDGSASPELATSWRYVGSGNKSFEMTLRHDARFSDGTPVNAAAVKTWIAYWSKVSPNASELGRVKRIQTTGPWTVRVDLVAPNAALPFIFSDQYPAGAVVSPSGVAAAKTLGTATAGAGPYMLVSSQTVVSDHYTFVPNPYYYDKSAVKFRKVVVKILTQPASMLQAATTGQLDVALGDQTDAPAAARAGLDVVTAPGAFIGMFFLNRGPLADVRVRQALSYAIDRQAVVDGTVGHDYGVPTSQPLNPDAVVPELQNYYAYDPAKARALLAAAGYPHGFTLKIISEGFLGTLGAPVAEAVAKYYQAIGVKVQLINPATQAQFNQEASANTQGFVEAEYESFPIADDYSHLVNQTGDATLDNLFKQASAAADPSSDWKAMQREIVTKALMVCVFNEKLVWYVSKHIGGVNAFGPGAPRSLPSSWYLR